MSGSSPSTRAGERFPSTLWSEILSLRDPASPEFRARLNRLIQRYWKPVYQAVRAGWSRDDEEARDLTQEFFLMLLDGEIVSAADPGRGSFRKYLRTVLRHFLINRKEAARALKRGGGRAPLSLDFDFDGAGPRPEPVAAGADPEAALDRAWAHELLAEAVADLGKRLEGRGETPAYRLFLDYDAPAAERPTGRALAERYSLAEHEVWRRLDAVRAELRSILLEKVSEYVADERELFKELDELFSL